MQPEMLLLLRPGIEWPRPNRRPAVKGEESEAKLMPVPKQRQRSKGGGMVRLQADQKRRLRGNVGR